MSFETIGLPVMQKFFQYAHLCGNLEHKSVICILLSFKHVTGDACVDVHLSALDNTNPGLNSNV